jgi:hypothetical protein
MRTALISRSRLPERTCRNPISTGLISGSKHSNFENRTE